MTCTRAIENGGANIITLGRGAFANSDCANKAKHDQPLNEFEAEKLSSSNTKIKSFEL